MDTGTIFNIQRYSVHDGPGIRTTVFFKGCPLRCWWCHNPESQSHTREIMFSMERCIGCGSCTRNCLHGAIGVKDGKAIIDREDCLFPNECDQCFQSCPTNAIELIGRKIGINEVMKEIQKDLIFYDQSGGGVTFSGGEPLSQLEFLSNLLDSCKREGIHTVVDTSGYISWEKLSHIAPKVDLFLYDIKLINNDKHKKYTGVCNNLILENLIKLSKGNNKIFVRIPIIPGINDDEKNIIETGEFLSKLNIAQVNLLPYHNIGLNKYKKLRVSCELLEVNSPSEEKNV